MTRDQDHIFISYATEDVAVADWLARKLATFGYAVWYDRFKFLGGEPWPRDIDVAIKTRTFRMLGLLSRASIQKPNPTRERTLAQQLAKEFGELDFLVPLNIDGLRPTELPWTLSDTNYISFAGSWADGLRDVLKKLDGVNAPRVLANGRELAVATFDQSDVLRNEPERLLTNCFPVQVPDIIRCFETAEPLTPEKVIAIQKRWPCRRVGANVLAAFEPPPEDVQNEFRTVQSRQSLWSALAAIEGIRSRDLVVSLIHVSLHWLMSDRGLQYSVDRSQWYFPRDLVDSNRLRFTHADGSKTWLYAVGERTFWSPGKSQVYRYHLSPSLRVLRGTIDTFLVCLQVRIYFTDNDGTPLAGRTIVSRRKHLCKGWWNEEWLKRCLAVMQFLAGGQENIRIGTDESMQVVISADPLSQEVPLRIDDERAEAPADDILPRDQDEVDDENEDEQHG